MYTQTNGSATLNDMLEKDRVFAEKQTTVSPFRFNENVARVFEDMLVRSVPFYAEALKQEARMAQKYYRPGTRIYDLGCSHGNFGLLLFEVFGDAPFTVTAVDNSWPMIDRYAARLSAYHSDRCQRHIHLVCAGMQDIKIENASVVVLNLTLQFLKPQKRERMIQKIYGGLYPGGILLITEKTVNPDPELAQMELDFYRQFKRENGYSDLEISQKRDALEKVLIPDTMVAHEKRILAAGFSTFNVWLKWFNFVSMMAIK